MLALVEGRHMTGKNVFCVLQMTPEDAKSDDSDEVNEVNFWVNSPGISCNNSFKFEINEGPEKPFSDWVYVHTCTFPYIMSNNMLNSVLLLLHHLKRSPWAINGPPHLMNTPQAKRRAMFQDQLQFWMLQVHSMKWPFHSATPIKGHSHYWEGSGTQWPWVHQGYAPLQGWYCCCGYVFGNQWSCCLCWSYPS